MGIAAHEQRNVGMPEQRGESCQGRSVSRGATDYEHSAVCTVGDEMGDHIGSVKKDAEVSELYSCGHQNFLLHDTVALWAEASVCSGNERLGR